MKGNGCSLFYFSDFSIDFNIFKWEVAGKTLNLRVVSFWVEVCPFCLPSGSGWPRSPLLPSACSVPPYQPETSSPFSTQVKTPLWTIKMSEISIQSLVF